MKTNIYLYFESIKILVLIQPSGTVFKMRQLLTLLSRVDLQTDGLRSGIHGSFHWPRPA